MKVILNADIKGVGKKDQIINASDGYARNYLFPKNLACEANKENLSKLQAKQDSQARKKEEEKQQAIKYAKQIQEKTIQIKAKAGENGKIFGGITSKEISEQIKQQIGIEVDKKKIMLNETIKNLGVFNIEIKLYEGIIAKTKINIIAE